MDLRELHKQKISKEFQECFGGTWAMLIYDEVSVRIIDSLFKKSDLIDFGITGVISISEQVTKWEMPAIYFISGSNEICKEVNRQFKEKCYTSVKVLTLSEPKKLDPEINCKRLNLDIKMVEERIFKCEWEKIGALANILDARIIVSSFPYTSELAGKIEKVLETQEENEKEMNLLVLDRTIDMYSPLMFFFSFRSILSEISPIDCKDSYYKELKNKHLGEISDHLQYSVMKIQESLKKIDKKDTSINDLGKMVLETPKNVELKNNIEKYNEYVNKCFKKLELIKGLSDIQQDIVLGTDAEEKKISITFEMVYPYLKTSSLSIDDRVGLMLLLKAKGMSFTKEQMERLKSQGFSYTDMNISLKRENQMVRSKNRPYVYNISRYEPILTDVVEKFAQRDSVSRTPTRDNSSVESLRKSTMISSEKNRKKKLICIYMKNGLCTEELRIAYSLTERLGVEIIFGSDKILTRKEFLEEYRKNKELQEDLSEKKS